MAFSIMGILAVLLEVFRPVLPLLALVLVIDAALLALVIRRREHMQFAAARRAALVVAAIAFVFSLVALPMLTGASHGSLSGALDWLALFGASIGVAIAAALLAWPLLQLALGSDRRKPMIPIE